MKRAAAWRAMGPESKVRLFGSEAQVARLDDFMARATENPAGAVYERLKNEPVGSFDQLTAPDDAGITFLRDVQQHAPDTVPEIGRAKIEQWLTKATEMGKFQHADKLYAEWQALGPQTKRLLFGGPLQVQRLDKHFFTLAKPNRGQPESVRDGAYPEPRGASGGPVHTQRPLVAIQAQVGGYALAKLLYTARGAALVTRALTLSARAPAVSSAAATRAAWAAVANAAQAPPARTGGAPAAAPLVFPRAADAAPGEEPQ